MSYNYKEEKAFVFTERGQETFLRIRDRVNQLIDGAGCCTVEKALSRSSGDSFSLLACIDRLVELGEFQYIERTVNGIKPAFEFTQHKILVRR